LAVEQSLTFLGELPLRESIRNGFDLGKINIDSPAFKSFEILAAEVARQISIVNSQNGL
jgi:hypothetical protein